MIVRVTCMKNNHRVIYDNCTEIEISEFMDDDTEMYCIGYRLHLDDDRTVNFRNGFLIEVYANEWEYNNGYCRCTIETP